MNVSSEGEDANDLDRQVSPRSWWWLWWQHRHGSNFRRRDLPAIIRDGLLKAAVETGDLLRLKQLIRQGIYPHKMCDGGAKLLSISTIQNQQDIARVLIENGCCVNEASRDGSTPLLYATWNGHVSMVELLLEAGGVIRQRHGDSLAMIAAIHGHVHILKLLVVRGHTFTEVNHAQDTALHHACRHGHLACVRLLQQQPGIDVNAHNIWGQTGVMTALSQGHEAVARWLVCQGCDVTLADNTGRTALHISSTRGMYDTTGLLLHHGALLNHRDNQQRTALTEATYHNHCDIVRLLITHNADVTLPGFYPDISRNAVSPYILALVRRLYAVAGMLYEAGSEVHGSGLPADLATHPDLVSWVTTCQPRSLQSLCRLAIRRSLGHPCLTTTMRLPLAPRLRRYISFE